MNAFLNSTSPYVLSLLRFITGFLMMWHGTQKFFDYPPSGRPPSPEGLSPFMMLGATLEFVGGIMIMIGLLTRPVAFLLSGTMAVAYWMAHGLNGKGFLPILNGGELAALYCFVFFYLFFAGGGPLSVDALLFKSRSSSND